MAERQKTWITNWIQGLVNRRVPRLAQPPESLRSGLNLDLSDGRLVTRGGTDPISSGLPDGTIKVLEQVRFPTNSKSYMMAQVEVTGNSNTAMADGPGAKSYHETVWDEDAGAMYLWDPSGQEIWAYYPASDTWCELVALNTGPSSRLYSSAIFYDGQIWTFGGIEGATFKQDVWTFDVQTLMWEEVTTSGTPPIARSRHRASYWENGGSMVVWGGNATGYPGGVSAGPYLLDLDTLAWTTLVPSAGSPGARHWQFQVIIGDTLYIAGGLDEDYTHYTCVKTSLSVPEWIAMPNLPAPLSSDLGAGILGLTTGAAIVYDDTMVLVGGRSIMAYLDENLSLLTENSVQYDPATNEWNWIDLGPSDMLYRRSAHAATITDSGLILITGGYEWQDPDWVEVEDGIRSDPGTGNANSLYVSNTNLPSTSVAFSKILDVGASADTVSIAVLGDRAIIASMDIVPHVWSGGMTTDGSDWAYPLHVMLSENGEDYTDASYVLLDADDDTVLDIGGLSGNAELAIRTDVPRVDAFYVTMGTPNTNSSVSTISGSRSMSLPSSSAVTRHDLRDGLIAYWKKNSTVTGNFEGAECTLDDAAVSDNGDGTVNIPYTGHVLVDGQTVRIYDTTNHNGVFVLEAGSTGQDYIIITSAFVGETLSDSHLRLRPTLGTGNEAIYVEVGAFATIDDVDYRIDSITDDGEATGEVSISTSADSADCSEIFTLGDSDSEDSISISHSSQSEASVFTGMGISSSWTDLRQSSVRVIIPNASITGDGTTVKIQIRSGIPYYIYKKKVTTTIQLYALLVNGQWLYKSWGAPAAAGSVVIDSKEETSWTTSNVQYFDAFTISGASIVERDGSTADGTEAPTRLTFNGGSETATFTGWNQTVTTDMISFTIDKTGGKSYLVCIDMFYHNAVSTLPPPGAQSDGSIVTYLGPTATTSGDTSRGSYLMLGSGQTYWHVRTPDEAATAFCDETTVDVTSNKATGFQLMSGNYGIANITVDTMDDVAATPAVGYTSGMLRLNVSGLDAIGSIEIDQNTPSTSTIFHAVSFDDSETFSVFKVEAQRHIARLNVATWEYNDSATGTPNWVSASYNSLSAALQEAFAISYNQMTKTEFEAIDGADWETLGFVPGETEIIDFAFQLTGTAPYLPRLISYTISYEDISYLDIKYWMGTTWTSGDVWEDGTQLVDVPLAQTGSISYSGCGSPISLYTTLNDIPGFWWRIKLPATSASASIGSVKYKAPCQPLQSIGTYGQDTVAAFIVQDGTTGNLTDYASIVSDFTETEISSVPVPLTDADAIYIVGVYPFMDIDLTPGVSNENTAAVSLSYWNGSNWITLGVSDGTVYGSSPLAQRGKLSYSVPENWKSTTVFPGLSPGYAIKLTVSASLSAASTLTEVRITSIPLPLVKHKYVASFGNRLALIGRSDARDQADISGEFTEYDWTSANAGAYRIGGPDRPQAAIAANGTIFVAKPQAWYYLGSDFTWQGHETPYTPVNSVVLVNAPVQTGDGARSALVYLGYQGAYAFSGLSLDQLVDAARPTELSANVNWWREGEYPYLDLNNLWRAAGAVWGDLIVWTVPMLLTSDDTAQTTNNRLIIFDTRANIWYPPYDIAVASLAQAFSYNASAPGNLGVPLLYGGNYSGEVVRLLDNTTDDGVAISYSAKSGLISCGDPGLIKQLLYLRVYGQATTAPTLNIYLDGKSTVGYTKSLTKLVTSVSVEINFNQANLRCQYLEIEVIGSGPMSIDAMEIQWQPLHRVEGQ